MQTTLKPLKNLSILLFRFQARKAIRRALILVLLKKPVVLKNILVSDDTKAMISCLQTLGIAVEKKERGCYRFGLSGM
jgi:5-enolpyruvylshikimate-3-phosphate synthase